MIKHTTRSYRHVERTFHISIEREKKRIEEKIYYIKKNVLGM